MKKERCVIIVLDKGVEKPMEVEWVEISDGFFSYPTNKNIITMTADKLLSIKEKRNQGEKENDRTNFRN